MRNRYFRSDPARSRGEGFADRIEVRAARASGRSSGKSAPSSAATRISPSSPIRSARWSRRDDCARSWLARPGRCGALRRRPRTGPSSTREGGRSTTSASGARSTSQSTARRSSRSREGPRSGSRPARSCPRTSRATPRIARTRPRPRRGGGWTAPDMARARRLVAASGPRGRACRRPGTGLPRGGRPAMSRRCSTSSASGRRCGCCPSMTLRGTPGRRSASPAGWPTTSARRPSSSRRSRARNGAAYNLSYICDPRLERLIARAAITPPADAARAWAAADHRVTDLAPVVPLTRRRTAVLVSKRAGNVKTHGQWFTLLDQMWVR